MQWNVFNGKLIRVAVKDKMQKDQIADQLKQYETEQNSEEVNIYCAESQE